MSRRAGFLLTVMTVALVMVASPAWAGDITVNSMEDAGDRSPGDGKCAVELVQPGVEPQCTLRAAIEEANPNEVTDTIVFDPGMSGTITLRGETLGLLMIENDSPVTDDLIIQGPGARKITVSANNESRLFQINIAAHATISGLTMIDGNKAMGFGISNFGTLNLSSTTVSGFGGGIYNQDGRVEVNNSTLSNNTAGEVGGGIANSGGEVVLTNTTVSNNTAGEAGGGIYNSTGSTIEMTNTTVSNNTASGGVGSESSGGGIYNSTGSTMTLANTIVARNTADIRPDASGTFNSEGNNLIGVTTGATGFAASDLKNVNPLLGPLQNNAGPTNTRALLPGSPAVDAARNLTCPPTDQRGVARKDGDKNGSVICDIGAFERNDLTPPKVSTTTPTAGKNDVRRNTNVTATFSEKMDRSTLNTSTFKLFRVASNGTTTQITNVAVSSSTDALKATLNPFGTSSTVLAANTRYKGVLTTAAKDQAGNRLDQNTTTGNQQKEWIFTTGAS